MCNIREMVNKVIMNADPAMVTKLVDMIEDLYEHSDKTKYQHDMYLLENGFHFNKESLDKAIPAKEMKWSPDTVCTVMNSNNIQFTGEYECVNMYDKCYVMNMLYHLYYPLISDSSSAAKFAEKYIKDPSYPVRGGKAYAEWSHRCWLKGELV